MTQPALNKKTDPAMVTDLGNGLFKLRLPTEFTIGDVNIYALDGDCRTLIDTGTGTERSKIALEQRLEELGWPLESIERIVISHLHVDHYGAAGWIQQRSGAEVWIHESARQQLEQLNAQIDRQTDWFAGYYRRSGLDEQKVEQLLDDRQRIKLYGGAARVSRGLRHGDRISLSDDIARCIHSPGHATSHVCFHLERRNWLFSADHILEFISPTPCMEPPAVDGEPKPNSLVDYRRSLSRFANLNPELILPGHGNNFRNLQRRIEQIRRHTGRRSRRLLKHLEHRKKSRAELVQEFFGNSREWDGYLTLSEVSGHLEWLIDQGQVRTFRENNIDWYQKSGPT